MEATTQPASVASSSMTQVGMPGVAPCNQPMTDQAVRAPTISTSPWAKLMSWMMPYTMV